MQGQILSASVTGNQGVILGDDGVQYSFTATDWRDNSARAASGMRVDFSGQGFFATEIRPTHSVNYAVSAPPNPVPSMSSPPVSPTTSNASARPQTGYIPPAAPNIPGEKKSKVVVGLLYIFLGPIGSLISFFYIGVRTDAVGILFLIGTLLTFPIQILLWPLYIILGIVLLCISDERFDKGVHIRRDHKNWNKKLEHCLTGECFAPDGRRLRSIPYTYSR